MAVDDVRRKDGLGDFQHAPAEQSKALWIIRPIAPIRTHVQSLPVKKRRIVHEKPPHGTFGRSLPDAGKMESVSERNRHAGNQGLSLVKLRGPVAGKHNSYLEPTGCERFRQR